MNWNELTKACLSMDIDLLGNNMSMIGDFECKDGLSEEGVVNQHHKPTYTKQAKFHAEQCRSCLQHIQWFIVTADKVRGRNDHNDNHDFLMRQAFKGVVLDAANCMTGVMAIVSEMAGKRMTATADAEQYLSQRFPDAEDNYLVFITEPINTLALLGSILIQQRGSMQFYNEEDFEFSIDNDEGERQHIEPSALCSDNGLIKVIPFLFVLLLHVAKCLDLAVKYYLLANSAQETYANAAAWLKEPDVNKPDNLSKALARVFAKHEREMEEELFGEIWT